MQVHVQRGVVLFESPLSGGSNPLASKTQTLALRGGWNSFHSLSLLGFLFIPFQKPKFLKGFRTLFLKIYLSISSSYGRRCSSCRSYPMFTKLLFTDLLLLYFDSNSVVSEKLESGFLDLGAAWFVRVSVVPFIKLKLLFAIVMLRF